MLPFLPPEPPDWPVTAIILLVIVAGIGMQLAYHWPK